MNNIVNSIMRSNTFVITSHYSPDGDNIGSVSAFYYALKKLNKQAYIVLDDEIPNNLKFLVANIDINKSSKLADLDKYTLIALDCGDVSRLCCEDFLIKNASSFINIDHHASNNNYGDFNYIDYKASSTCELVYNVLKNIDENVLDKNVGNSLYTGLVTDTGNFMYSNVKESTFLMAHHLLSIGIDKQDIIKNVYQSYSFNYFKILGEALSTLDIINGNIATISVNKELFKKYNITFNNVDGIVNYARDIEGVEVAIFFKEKKENETKISFRSKSYVDVNEIASLFGGGGHMRASGCTINEDIEKSKEIVLKEVLNYLGD